MVISVLWLVNSVVHWKRFWVGHVGRVYGEHTMRSSDNHCEDVVVDVEAPDAIRNDIEHLREPELLSPIHAQVATHEHDDAARDGPLLHVWAEVGVLDGFEAKGLNLFRDAFESDIGGAGVGHLAVLLVEVDEGLAGLAGELHDLEVLFEEDVGHLFHVHLNIISWCR